MKKKNASAAELIFARSEYFWSAHDLGILYLRDRALRKKAIKEGITYTSIMVSERFQDSVKELEGVQIANEELTRFIYLEEWLTKYSDEAETHAQSIQLNLSVIDSAITAATLSESVALTIAKLPNHPEIPDHETIHRLLQDHGLCAYFDREGKAAQNVILSYRCWKDDYFWLTGWNALVDMFAEAHSIPELSAYKRRLTIIEKQADDLNSCIDDLSCMIKDPACEDSTAKQALFKDVFPHIKYRSTKSIKAIRARADDLEALTQEIKSLDSFLSGQRTYSFIRDLCIPKRE